MLDELVIENLGVVERVAVQFGEGLTAITGETGAGKTLLITALGLLMGEKATAKVVRSGASEATVTARFFDESNNEVILRRTISSAGRSKAYVNGLPVTLPEATEATQSLLDVHGQNSAQGLLKKSEQRRALDVFAAIDTSVLTELRSRLRAIDKALADMGGDPADRERELEMLRFQSRELHDANINDYAEDEKLQLREVLLANAVSLREAGAGALALLHDDSGAYDAISGAIGLLKAQQFASIASNLVAAREMVADTSADIRSLLDNITDSPDELASIQERRSVLTQIRRKYGDTLRIVIDRLSNIDARIEELLTIDERSASLRAERDEVIRLIDAESARVRNSREQAAPLFCTAIADAVHQLALPYAMLDISFDHTPAADGVTILFSANPGIAPGPLSSIASGGELSRTMLAIRLVASGDTDNRTLIFDEVDAGIGGEAAMAVARALAKLAERSQVLLVTHLPQVAAFADVHIQVNKRVDNDVTATGIEIVVGEQRIVELSRMLSGQPDSSIAHDHAEELLDLAKLERVTMRSGAK